MNYVQLTDEHRQAMLAAIGVDNVEALYASLPAEYRLGESLDIPAARSELELRRELATRSAANSPAAADDAACFLGGGAYDHFIPSAVDALAHQRAFVTAYTPYQAEASQGQLQAFFEFQTQVTQLAGLDIANASLYEGATAAAEGIMMALNTTGRRRVVVASTVHPDTIAVIKTYLSDLPVELVFAEADASGTVSPQTAAEQVTFDTACVVVQSPNVLGLVEDWSAIYEAAKAKGDAKGPLGIAIFNPIASGLLKTPGQCGADIATAEGQPLGIPLQFGGPYLGLFAAKQQFVRKMPGRLVGQTVDGDGNRGFCLTLQTREQHIRGAKATSNVCTNQGLMALRATVFMSAVGKTGIRNMATQCWHKAHYAAKKIAGIDGCSLAYQGAFFNEFVINCKSSAQAVIDAGRDRKIFPGLCCKKLGIGSENQLLIAVTEKRSKQQIDELAALIAEVK